VKIRKDQVARSVSTPGVSPTRLRKVVMDPLGHLPRSKGKGNDRAAPLVGLALAFAAIIACARPSLAPGTPPGTGLIAKEMAGLRISVEAEAWHGKPRDLAKRVLPFLFILRNTGPNAVTITRTDFLLLDDSSRQYLPLPPSEVVTMLGGRVEGATVSPSVGVSGSTAGGTIFGVGLGITLGGSGADTRDIIPQALAEGPILPAAEVKGFLYFQQPAPGFKNLRLVVVPRDLPGQPRLEFEFRPIAP